MVRDCRGRILLEAVESDCWWREKRVSVCVMLCCASDEAWRRVLRSERAEWSLRSVGSCDAMGVGHWLEGGDG